eukprot:IDg6258t1
MHLNTENVHPKCNQGPISKRLQYVAHFRVHAVMRWTLVQALWLASVVSRCKLEAQIGGRSTIDQNGTIGINLGYGACSMANLPDAETVGHSTGGRAEDPRWSKNLVKLSMKANSAEKNKNSKQ